MDQRLEIIYCSIAFDPHLHWFSVGWFVLIALPFSRLGHFSLSSFPPTQATSGKRFQPILTQNLSKQATKVTRSLYKTEALNVTTIYRSTSKLKLAPMYPVDSFVHNPHRNVLKKFFSRLLKPRNVTQGSRKRFKLLSLSVNLGILWVKWNFTSVLQRLVDFFPWSLDSEGKTSSSLSLHVRCYTLLWTKQDFHSPYFSRRFFRIHTQQITFFLFPVSLQSSRTGITAFW